MRSCSLSPCRLAGECATTAPRGGSRFLSTADGAARRRERPVDRGRWFLAGGEISICEPRACAGREGPRRATPGGVGERRAAAPSGPNTRRSFSLPILPFHYSLSCRSRPHRSPRGMRKHVAGRPVCSVKRITAGGPHGDALSAARPAGRRVTERTRYPCEKVVGWTMRLVGAVREYRLKARASRHASPARRVRPPGRKAHVPELHRRGARSP